ncbi:MAG: YybS family protein [Syntrophales bacterium]|nr:YybS family protein [Syntrophales bacterium]
MGRGLVIWFLCLGALLVGFLGAQVNPLVYLVVGVLAPLPVLVIGWRSGELAAGALAVVGAVVIFSLHPAAETIWQNLGFLNLLLMGVMVASLQCRGVTAPQAIMVTVAALTVGALLIFLGQAVFMGISPQDLLAQKSAEVMDTVRKVLGDGAGGVSDSVVPGVAPAQVEALLQRLLPGLLVTNMALVAWLNVVLSRQIISLLGWGTADPPLYHWAAPEWLIFVLLGSGFLLLVPVTGARFFGLNLLMVVAVLYFCQGVAVVATWFNRLGLPRLLRMIGYPLLFLNPFFFVIITLGLLDLWLDFRRLHKPKDA